MILVYFDNYLRLFIFCLESGTDGQSGADLFSSSLTNEKFALESKSGTKSKQRALYTGF